MNFHIFKLFAFVFVLVVFVFEPILAKPQMPSVPQVPQVTQVPPVPQMPGMPYASEMSNAATAGMGVGQGFAQTGMGNIPSSDSMNQM